MEEPSVSVIAPPEPIRATPTASRRPPTAWIVLGLLVAAGGVGAGYYFLAGQGHGAEGHAATPGDGDPKGESADVGMPVDAAYPRAGGVDRVTIQPGSVHAFEHSDLYAKVSGYLKVQDVDIGDRVTAGQLLAVIDDPEVDKAVEQNEAALEQAKARVGVAEAKIRSAEAEKQAADAMTRQARAEVAAKESNRTLQEKQLRRIGELVERRALEQRLQDEQQDRRDVAASDLGVAEAAVLSAQAQAQAKAAAIEEARADLAEARANVLIARANLDKARVYQSYTRITAPYDGVITLRSFHIGDFIQDAGNGGKGVPLLAVSKTDKMRVVFPMPDVDVPFADKDDPATLQIVALPGRTFHGVISRFAESEDPRDRNMRTEVDIPNPDGKLTEGMYGKITVLLQPAAKDGVTIPSSALQSQDGLGNGAVFVVRDGKARKVKVQVGNDNGVEAEVLEGLAAEDQVVFRYNGTLVDGTAVRPEVKPFAKAPAPAAGH